MRYVRVGARKDGRYEAHGGGGGTGYEAKVVVARGVGGRLGIYSRIFSTIIFVRNSRLCENVLLVVDAFMKRLSKALFILLLFLFGSCNLGIFLYLSDIVCASRPLLF